MIHLSDTYQPSKHIRRRSALMWAVKLPGKVRSIVRYRVKPFGQEFDHHNKAKRIVTFDLESATAECVDRFTGEVCEANSDVVPGTDRPKTPRMCSHVYAALQRLEINSRRQKAA